MFMIREMRASQYSHVVWLSWPQIKRFTEIERLGSVLLVICVSSLSICGEGFPVAPPERKLSVGNAGNTRNGLRFQDRRERDFHPFRCGAELGPEEFALADADGVSLLRHRVDGHGCVTIRYLAVRRRSNALLAASM